MARVAGVLMPLSSLPGTMGIGDLGKDAYTWLHDLSKTGSSLWQVLPLNPVGYGNSPYQTYSSFAGDEIYICLEDLYESMNLEIEWETIEDDSVDYDEVRKTKTHYLKEAYKHFKEDKNYEEFIIKAHWLDEYADFMALRTQNGNTSWVEWTELIPDPKEANYHKFLQFVFFEQWKKLKTYAEELNIKIVGDLPIYLGHDSAEVYFNRDLFFLGKDGRPTLVAGVPPDYFSEEGQLWGNPIYNWDAIAKTDYKFWVDRLKWNQTMFDVIRLDHFRAFDTYWVVDGEATSAIDGEWRLGPAHDFFDAMYRQIENLDLVVEDLGDLRPEVLQLRDDYELMGMQIIQFALKTKEIERDETMKTNMLVYTGTHDNETLGGWKENMPLKEQVRVAKELAIRGVDDDHIIDQICHYTLRLKADWAILPIQDIMRLSGSTRINSPGTVGSPNWEWKLDTYSQDYTDGLKRLTKWVHETRRCRRDDHKGGQ
ncbi:4-alpha-glucanotransferase [Erysipelothrix sp. HDW6A]|uniref:4-alpha-glucanotransferase n=1 Tax=Erysipelothrix sp. HDW6A TaxID=2714928 RepID=UPI00140999A8|nr:4-alpha-glucanotransferase [Erysipelothrix sp. HDW6A]QIK56835.1 4-alpha-glucanotransferase [Erysipelothrix sp. HDW6A]